MTGDCGDQEHIGYQIFHKIAATSSGQVFTLDKQQVSEVRSDAMEFYREKICVVFCFSSFEILNFVQYSIQTRKVNLLVIEKIKRNKQTYTLPVDSKLVEFTISVSGGNPQVVLIDPSSKIFFNISLSKVRGFDFSFRKSSQSPDMVYTTSTSERSVYSQHEESHGINQTIRLMMTMRKRISFQSGEWQIQITSSSAHSIRVTGLSRLTFRHGFSSNLVTDLTRTRRQPIQGKNNIIFNCELIDEHHSMRIGASNYLMIDISNEEDIQNAQQIELIDLFGNILVDQIIEANINHSNLYSTREKFQPPVSSFFFYIRVFHDTFHNRTEENKRNFVF